MSALTDILRNAAIDGSMGSYRYANPSRGGDAKPPVCTDLSDSGVAGGNSRKASRRQFRYRFVATGAGFGLSRGTEAWVW